MRTLSYTQEYFLCAINGKGRISVSAGKLCLIVSGITELVGRGYIARDGKEKLVAVQGWDNGLPYLKPLYETIAAFKKPRRIGEIAINYSGKRFNELFSAVGASLTESGCADEMTKKGLVRETTKYIPRTEAVKRVVEKVRAEFLGEGGMSDGTICLAALLDVSGMIKKYFSKFERPDIKKRIEEARKNETYAAVKKILDEITAAMVCVIAAAT